MVLCCVEGGVEGACIVARWFPLRLSWRHSVFSVDLFMDVLDGLDGVAYLGVDMGVVGEQEMRVI